MFIYPLFRMQTPRESGLSFIIEGHEIATNPPIDVLLKKADGSSHTLVIRNKHVSATGYMYVEAVFPGGLGMDGGVGSVTVTVTGTSDNITAQVGYGEPGISPVISPAPVVRPA